MKTMQVVASIVVPVILVVVPFTLASSLETEKRVTTLEVEFTNIKEIHSDVEETKQIAIKNQAHIESMKENMDLVKELVIDLHKERSTHSY